MDDEKSLCVVCAWRDTCRKRFLSDKDISLRCPDFTRDIAINKGVKPDVKKEDHTDR